MKKVLQFLPALPMGGAETLVKDYCLGLDKAKYNVSVLCLKKINSPYETLLADNNIKVSYINEKNCKNLFEKILFVIKRIFFIRNYLKMNMPDVIHVHLAINIYLLFCHIQKKTKLFLTIHTEPNVLWKKNKIDFFVVKYLVKYKNLQIITLHEDMKKEVNGLFRINNTLVINNGIFFEKYQTPVDKKTERKKLNIPENALVIGHVGRFETVKNHPFLIEVFKACLKNNHNYFLLMVGNGSLKEVIEDQLKRNEINNCSLILSERTDVPDLLRCMDYFVFPSFFEGFGIVLIESQIAGLKTLASDTIPKQTKISNLIKYKSLKASAEDWADEILKWDNKPIEYFDMASWNMKNVILKLQDFYEGIYEKNPCSL